MKFLRLFKKDTSLRIVNFAGLAIMFACLLISMSYIREELSYDRHHANADRIVRLSLQLDDKPVDGRVFLVKNILETLQQIPEIERIVRMYNTYTIVLSYQGKKVIVKDAYAVNHDFLNVFDLPLLYGEIENVLQRRGQVLFSESFARQLFDDYENVEFQNSKIIIESRKLGGDTVFISGIFKDMPKTSHFKTDILLYLPDENSAFNYVYLLLKKDTDINELTAQISKFITESEVFTVDSVRAFLMPLTDIHLHSHNLVEMRVNGNIYYIYLIIGANALLLIVVLLNLWLNTSLIFARNRRYYQLLRLHGTTSSTVFRNELLSALFLGIISMLAGLLATYYVSVSGYFPVQISVFDTVTLCVVFLFALVIVSLIPVLKDISLTQFLNTGIDLKPVRFSYFNVKYMLMAQYAVVMLVVILAFGINKQMNLMKNTQVGGNEQNILVMTEQPEQVQTKYKILKSELLKYKEIEGVTACFQLPGDAIRDNFSVRKEEDSEWYWLPIMIVDEDFIPFFRIPLIAGKGFSQNKFDYQTELAIAYERWLDQKFSEHIEEYVINRKALSILGFNNPEEAIGKMLHLQHNIDYFNKGTIVGVTDDFNYTGLYDEANAMIIIQRNLFLYCIMARLNSNNYQQARTIFENVWNEVNPDYPADYVFMNDIFNNMYRNEMNAQYLVFIFSLLCLTVTNLGLIIFMAFIIRRRTKEIGLRKVHGASIGEILKMLNVGFIQYVAVAFVVATPAAWYIMHRWLDRFAYKTSLDWWIFALAGLSVLLVSVLAVLLQSWRAATANPVDAIKIE
jgi:putative ABC transport system permease protein